jgi:hypothetical protein
MGQGWAAFILRGNTLLPNIHGSSHVCGTSRFMIIIAFKILQNDNFNMVFIENRSQPGLSLLLLQLE